MNGNGCGGDVDGVGWVVLDCSGCVEKRRTIAGMITVLGFGKVQ